MNLTEFIFVFAVVFGTTGFWMWWTTFVYSFEDKPSKKVNDEAKKTTKNTQKSQINDYRDLVDYDGMGNQGRFPVSK